MYAKSDALSIKNGLDAVPAPVIVLTALLPSQISTSLVAPQLQVSVLLPSLASPSVQVWVSLTVTLVESPTISPTILPVIVPTFIQLQTIVLSLVVKETPIIPAI